MVQKDLYKLRQKLFQLFSQRKITTFSEVTIGVLRSRTHSNLFKFTPFKVNNKDIKTTSMTPLWCCIVYFVHILHNVQLFPFLTLSKWLSSMTLKKAETVFFQLFIDGTLSWFILYEIGSYILQLISSSLQVVRCAIWYHLYNLKNVKKNTQGEV